MYSLNNNGPCINGRKLSCKGDEVASEITCECPPHYQGMFCEDKMENVIEMFSMFFFPRPLVVILWASTDANMMIFYINIYHHALLITKTCNFRLRDSVIESQTLRLTPCRNVTSQKETVSHTVGTDGMLSIVTKLMHLRKEAVRGCMNHKHCYNKCMTVLVYLLFYISQNCHCAKTQKISQCPPLSLMLLTRLSPEIQRRFGSIH